MNEKPKLSANEWTIMNTIWKICHYQKDVTVKEVMVQLQEKKKWHVSSVKTTMERLIKKGVLSGMVRGNTCFYKPELKRDSVVKKNLKLILDNILDGAFGPVVNYLADKKKLTDEEVREIEAIISKKTAKKPVNRAEKK